MMRFIIIILSLFSFVFSDAQSNKMSPSSVQGLDKVIKNVGEGKDTTAFFYSGRQHLVLNTWKTFSNIYGISYQQFSQTAGTGTNPSIGITRNGYIVPNDGRVTSVYIKGTHNNVEEMTVEVDVSCFRVTNDSSNKSTNWRVKTTYTTNSKNTKILDIPINEDVSKGDQILISMRKVNGTTTTRYLMYGALIYTEN